MRRCALLFIVTLLGAVAVNTAAQTLPAPQAITDPKKIASKPNAQVDPRSLTIEKLYMTRQVGRPTWSPDGKNVAFISNMSGRNNLWLVPSDGGWPAKSSRRWRVIARSRAPSRPGLVTTVLQERTTSDPDSSAKPVSQ